MQVLTFSLSLSLSLFFTTLIIRQAVNHWRAREMMLAAVHGDGHTPVRKQQMHAILCRIFPLLYVARRLTNYTSSTSTLFCWWFRSFSQTTLLLERGHAGVRIY